MVDRTEQQAAAPTRMPTLEQVSSGGVAFRRTPSGVEVAIVAVGHPVRWQLPKGIVDPGETPEMTAVREVREEAGIDTRLIAPINTIEYWYVGTSGGQRVRFHKFVHFFLLEYQAGEVGNHDHEVHEARWVKVEAVLNLLTFKNERAIAERAQVMISEIV